MEATAANMGGSLVLRGTLTILFGAAAVFWPGLTLTTLVFLFSSFILISGVIDLVMGVGHLFHSGKSILTRVATLLLGVFEIGVGVYMLRHTFLTLSLFLTLVGFTLLLQGIFQAIGSLFEEGPSGWRLLMIVIGALTALAGIIVLFQPVAGGVAFVWVLGVYALVSGPLMIALAVQMNNAAKKQKLHQA